MIECRNVMKKYGSKVAVNGISLCLEKGHIYGLLGPNGSGKSTLMKMMVGLVVPEKGEIIFTPEEYGADAAMSIGAESKNYIAYMPTESFYFGYMKIRDVGKYYRTFFEDFDNERFEQLITKMDLNPKQKVRTLSSGMMAKLKIAATLSRRAELIMLDEPLNGIDLLARDTILDVIMSYVDAETILLVSSHLVEELERAIDTAIFMKDGRIAACTDVDALHRERGLSVADYYREIYGSKEAEQCEA